MSEIKAIIFDLGGVIVKEVFDEEIPIISKEYNITEQEFKNLRSKYHQEMLRGLLSIREFDKIIAEKFHTQRNLKIWNENYLKMTPINEELLQLVLRLKNYKIAMISNIYDVTAEAEKSRGIFNHFKPCILSCEVGLAKPNSEIFELTLKKLNLKASECIFIDDKEKNVISARNLGINSILFKNNKDLLLELKKAGVEFK